MPLLISNLRRLIRVPLLLMHVAVGVVVINLAVVLDQPWKGGFARRSQVFWCRSICALLGVRVSLHGSALSPQPVLIACNHISWLDILVVSANWDVGFVSKSEVRGWPGVGSVASGLGTLFIERGKRDAAARTIRSMAERLREGGRVLFFPEGTTSVGEALLPFRPRLFQAAIDAGVSVLPMTLCYTCRRDGRRSEAVPFVGAQSLLMNIVRLAGEPGVDVRLTVGSPVPSRDRGRNQLALLVQDQVGDALMSQNGNVVTVK